MIIKRKLFTRQEAKAMKEIYEALKKGNLGRNLSAKDFVRLRHVSNDTVRAIHHGDKNMISDFSKNSEAIKNLGLPETSKAYQRMIEKYSNIGLEKRFERIQDAKSTSRLRKLRKQKKELEKDVEFFDPMNPDRFERGVARRYPKSKKEASEKYKNVLEEIEKVKKERGSKKKYKFNKKGLEEQHIKEEKNLDSLLNDANLEARNYKVGTKSQGAKTSWRIKNQMQKEGIDANIDSNKGSYYSPSKDRIHVNRGDSRDPLTIIHEPSHKISQDRGEVVGKREYYRHWRKLDPDENTSYNYFQSLKNRLGDLTTLTEEANASYHATTCAKAKKYGISKKQLKNGKSILDGAFKTYERDAAMGMNFDNLNRALGKAKNK